MWIDLDGSKFNIDHAFALRPVGKHGKQCTLFPNGASPVDGGFLIDMPLDEVFEAIQAARLMEIADMMPGDDILEEVEPEPE